MAPSLQIWFMIPLSNLRVPLWVAALLISSGMALFLKTSVVLSGWFYQTNYSHGIIFRRGAKLGLLFVLFVVKMLTAPNIYLFNACSGRTCSLTWVINITLHLTLSLIIWWSFWRTGLLDFQSTPSAVSFPSTLCGYYGKRGITICLKGKSCLCSVCFNRWFTSLKCIAL